MVKIPAICPHCGFSQSFTLEADKKKEPPNEEE
jgi:thymidine kinase